MAWFGLIVSSLLPALALCAVAQGPVVSPEVHSDRTVTFRFRDLGAKKVDLSLEGSDSVPMEKGADGVWTYTTPPLAPDLYGYTFSSDGQARLDIHNPTTKPNLIWVGNMVMVPGSPPQPWEVQHVPHGTLHRHFYKSDAVGDERDYFVYTPPGYNANRGPKLPVLYLLHGYSDTANGWTSVGQAHTILDNLIAEGKTKPMVVVMTLGYGDPHFATGVGEGFPGRRLDSRSYELYTIALLGEVIPQVEREYRVSTNRAQRAIAGLSMGGAETLHVGLNHLDKFSYVGAFSSGGLSNNFDKEFPEFEGAKANKALKELWVSCGTDDGLITFNRNLIKWLHDKKARVDVHETPGRHAWMVWRRNLAEFSQLLFK